MTRVVKIAACAFIVSFVPAAGHSFAGEWSFVLPKA